jgi:hypothetical protein
MGRARSVGGALSDEEPAVRLAMVASDHQQSVPIFQQLSGGHPSGRDDVRAIPLVATQRRGFAGRARDRGLLRNRAPLGESFRTDDCSAAAQAPSQAACGLAS